MKLKVCVAFTDKYTGDSYSIGDEIEVSEKRGAELIADPQKLVEAIEGPKPKMQKSASAPRAKRGEKKA